MINVRYDHATKRRDERGFLVDFLKGDELPSRYQRLGQIYFVTFDQPHVIRGNHYHKTKNEWFVVVLGKVKLVAENVKTKERREYILDGDHDKYERVFIGKHIAHTFQNISKTAMMLNYADKSYHDESPDTTPYKIL